MSRWSRRRRAGATPEVLAALVAGLLLLIPLWVVRGVILVGRPEARAGIKGYPLDLAYGASKASTPQRPPVIAPPTPPSFDGGHPKTPVVSIELCPKAGPNVFPAEPASFDIRGTVAAGSYLWQQKGTMSLATFRFPAPSLASRVITNIRPETDGSYSYDVVSTSLIGRRVETILVQPGTAISLTHLSIQGSGGATREFAPLTPVTLLPLPVTIGATVTGAGVDPTHQRAMIVQGTVTGRLRVDACGEIVDSWLVQGTREFRDLDNPSAAPGTYNYAIAPQLGGLFVYDHVVENGTLSSSPPLPYSFDIEASIGQLRPRS